MITVDFSLSAHGFPHWPVRSPVAFALHPSLLRSFDACPLSLPPSGRLFSADRVAAAAARKSGLDLRSLPPSLPPSNGRLAPLEPFKEKRGLAPALSPSLRLSLAHKLQEVHEDENENRCAIKGSRDAEPLTYTYTLSLSLSSAALLYNKEKYRRQS